MRNYRGKTKEGKWVKGSLWIKKKANSTFVKYYIWILDGKWVEVIPSTVGQSTGLKDKNKKEGYAGDEVQDNSNNKYLIVWDDEDAAFYLQPEGTTLAFPMKDLKRYEIIGTIHDKEK